MKNNTYVPRFLYTEIHSGLMVKNVHTLSMFNHSYCRFTNTRDSFHGHACLNWHRAHVLNMPIKLVPLYQSSTCMLITFSGTHTTSFLVRKLISLSIIPQIFAFIFFSSRRDFDTKVKKCSLMKQNIQRGNKSVFTGNYCVLNHSVKLWTLAPLCFI